MEKYWQVFTDGGARGNPGPAGIGVVIEECVGDECQALLEKCEYIGEATNNQAEYRALLLAMEELIKLKASQRIIFHLDSRLVVEQVKGVYKIKNPELKLLLERFYALKHRSGVEKLEFVHIPRESNKRADKLVNQALDEALLIKG